MDITRIMDTPVAILEAWLPIIDLEIEQNRLNITSLEAQIVLQKNEIEHAENIIVMALTAIDLKKRLNQAE